MQQQANILTSEKPALLQVEQQLQSRGYSVTRMPRNSPDGDLHATKGHHNVRLEVKGLQSRNGVWLPQHQIDAVDIIVVYIVAEDSAWVLSPQAATDLLNHYHTDFVVRNGYPPAEPGWNGSQFPPPTGWAPLDDMLPG